MREIEKFKNITSFIKDIQKAQLERICDLVIASENIDRAGVFNRNRYTEYVNVRRIIAFIARIYFNISGGVIASYLNMSKEMVSDYVHNGFTKCKKNTEYEATIRGHMVMLTFRGNDYMRPIL